MSAGNRRATGLSRRAVAMAAAGVLVVGAIIAVVVLIAAPSPSSAPTVFAMGLGVPRSAPAGWHRSALADGGGVLAYPPAMHLVEGDRGTVSAAQLNRSGRYLLYLNATPRQGDETLQNWPSFRVSHLLDDDASVAHELASTIGVRFLGGGTGTCVSDTYVTKVGAHHFTEIACFVLGLKSASVIIAAAPTASWTSSSSLLRRAIAGYQVQ